MKVASSPDGTIITSDPQTGEAEDRGNISDHDVERGRDGARGRRNPGDNY
jgi:hypothetical protein